MNPNGSRIPYSTYPSQGYLPHSQQVPSDAYHTSLPSHQLPQWSHPQYNTQGYEVPSQPSQQPQMWLPMPLMPTHQLQQHSPYDHHHHHQQYAMHSPLNDSGTRTERSHSLATTSISSGIPSPEASPRTGPRAESPGHADLNMYGFMNPEGTWSCAYPGCTSRAVFTRGCDLRKHHKRHTKSFFCRYPGCSQASGGGFSSKKDLARHEAKHNPGVVCEWGGCDRIFSRVDNMRDHVKRIHLKSHRSPGKGSSSAM
ncbi:hypothetical protein BT63DRAFT_460530 [Microthyrium microscopicum]|uniref:C2H2-type domain-containing protein n=1 Tax=Microthyrium microscopicum TaxID=703497 RepID=A0A6A6TVZ4_9PEZI|nr:hypothetical protein BT63DRAFT_460530 [Microthyrium microscopicum]